MNAPNPTNDLRPNAPVSAEASALPARVLAFPASARAVTIKEAAAMLSICERTIRREIDRGRLRAYRIGRAIRIRVSDIEAYLNNSQVGP